ncbi:hypothetical protein BAUCODRAFT_194417 [Baudoinia panamericana UAMH 10762]|uniref:PH domain-containing protein n=1 Tax=Baudoinia panamericana (strain UAMH 10762) TaxID=717646 RepID=M2NQ00_BAUPA|nr:uncharacterized protein BAUCODRAFT_194417 [Baudoinia panamericana UAMH 10762]EMD01071.1 hypothetical protein BAUCODRAFT_194417 [Baudoinia panamericana UAMH 10762]
MSETKDTITPFTSAAPHMEPATATTTQPELSTAGHNVSNEAGKPLVNGELANHSHHTSTVPLSNTQDEITPVNATPATAPVEETKPAAEKTVEPLTEGLLGYKGPGLLKSLVPTKKEFWLSDLPVTPQHMDLFMRGEKPEVSNAIVAWASQTGKGLLFFNKKGESDRKRPQSVIPLYDAEALKKEGPHDIHFRVHAHQHTLKAANETERDGWYMSLERAMEMGKAEKESMRASEGYKAEMEKLTGQG